MDNPQKLPGLILLIVGANFMWTAMFPEFDFFAQKFQRNVDKHGTRNILFISGLISFILGVAILLYWQDTLHLGARSGYPNARLFLLHNS